MRDDLKIQFPNYVTAGDNSHALVGDLADSLALLAAEPVASGDTWAMLANGQKVDWSDQGFRPHRRTGSTRLTDPASFAEFVTRHAVEETAIYADRSAGRIVAVFNDHPAVPGVDETSPAVASREEDATAGRRDFFAVLELAIHDEWATWTRHDDRSMTQRAFGEFLEDVAHTVVEPASATMVEVATTLTMRRKLDYDSRVRLDNGDQSFKFEEESTMRAGRGSNQIEIPTQFGIRVPIWEGTPTVDLKARLRIRAGSDGVAMTYKLIRRSDAVEAAFEMLLADIRGGIPTGLPIFIGSV